MPSSVDRISILLERCSYEIVVGDQLLASEGAFSHLPASSSAVIVTNETVGPLYERRLAQILAERCSKVSTVVLRDGEQFKDWNSVSQILDHLVSERADRKTLIYALGGGVVGDIAGFAASCFMRGIDFVQVPTTLLAQVDSSVGGKTGINHPSGKNLIGAFHQPLKVIADTSVLSTLPDREFRAGLAEVVKYGPIADEAFFSWLESHAAELLARDPEALRSVIGRCCEIKAKVVSSDEREEGVRAILNFGHTFGHAIETGMGYGAWLHGEAVACGMVLASDLSVKLGSLKQAERNRIKLLLERLGLPTRPPCIEVAQFLELMRGDKKASLGEARYVVLEGLGAAALVRVPDSVVSEVLDEALRHG